jgi:hypothetical protein
MSFFTKERRLIRAVPLVPSQRTRTLSCDHGEAVVLRALQRKQARVSVGHSHCNDRGLG